MEEQKEVPQEEERRSFIKEFHDNLEEPLRVYWYAIVFIFLTIYVIVNRDCVADFTFFTDFDGMNLLFVIWVAMMVLPCLGSFEFLGLKYNSFGKKIKGALEKAATVTKTEEIKTELDKLLGGDKDEK